MRRMYSEKQIKNLVNEGIEKGEIDGKLKIYLHKMQFKGNGNVVYFTCISNNSKDFSGAYNSSQFAKLFENILIQIFYFTSNSTETLILAIEDYENTIELSFVQRGQASLISLGASIQIIDNVSSI